MSPHWSATVEWRHDRWDPMSNAPDPWKHSEPREVRGRLEDGRIVEPMHFAQDLSGEEQPAFSGWFIPSGRGFTQVRPVEWQPLHGTFGPKA